MRVVCEGVVVVVGGGGEREHDTICEVTRERLVVRE